MTAGIDEDTPDGEIAELPPYRAVLVADAKGFGGNSDADQGLLADTIPDVVELAFQRTQLGHVWREALFPHITGDGLGIGFETRHLPAVVSRFFDTLQQVLAERDVRLRAHGRRLRLRMRASLNVGPVGEPAPGTSSAVALGRAFVTTHRLLDSPAVRDVLTRSDPDHTFLSVIVSQRVFDDVVVAGYADVPFSRFVPRQVEVKEFGGTVYLYVPEPSGELLRHGLGDAERAGREAEPAPPAGSTTNIMTGTHYGDAIQVGHLHGDVSTGWKRG